MRSPLVLTGTVPLARFALRRDRVRLPIWVLAVAGLVTVQANQSLELYSESGALAAYEQAARGNAAIIATTGPPVGLDTIGGAVAFELWSTVAVVVALMSMFTVARHTRVDEEAGRTELLRSARVDRHAPVTAAVLVAVLANLTVLVAVTAAGSAAGLPVRGSLAFGAALAAIGLTFTGVTAIAAQVVEHGRAVFGLVSAVLGVSFLLRAAGDIGESWVYWLSPLGWGMAVHPYSDDRWWPVVLCLVVAAASIGVAYALVDRRDVGAGLVQPRLGRARASRTLTTPIGLAWRLQRGAFVAWAAGIAVSGLAFGAMAPAIEELIGDNPELQTYLDEMSGGLVDAYLVVVLVMLALLTAAYGITAVLRAGGEEAAGRAEPVLATATSRPRWMGSHLVAGLAGSAVVMAGGGVGTGLGWALAAGEPDQLARVVGSSLVYVPAVWLLVGVAAAVFGVAPRLAAPVAWAALAYCVVMGLLADQFGWPESAGALSPFQHTPQAPVEAVTALPLLVLVAVAVALVGAGLGAFRRRDLVT